VRAAIITLTDDDGFGELGQPGDEGLGMRGNDELRALGGVEEEIGDLRDDIGVQAELGFFDTDQGRRLGMQKNGQQAEVVEDTIREASCRKRLIQTILMKEDPDGPSLSLSGDVINTFIDYLKLLEQEAFGCAPVLEVVEDEPQITPIL